MKFPKSEIKKEEKAEGLGVIGVNKLADFAIFMLKLLKRLEGLSFNSLLDHGQKKLSFFNNEF